MEVEPAAFTGVGHADWLDPAVEVFQEGSSAVPRTIGGPDGWQRVAPDEMAERRLLPAVTVTDIASGVDTILFHVDRIGVPVLVRTSFFPNWEVAGADGPWRTTPNLMVVVPTGNDVALTYGRTGVDIVSMLLSLVGLVALVVLARRPDSLSDRPPLGSEWYDLAAVGPDGDLRLDNWVQRRVAGPAHPDEQAGPNEQTGPDGANPGDELGPDGTSATPEATAP